VWRDDADRPGSRRYLYEVDVSDPARYDLVVNMERLSYDAAIEAIDGLARRPEVATTDAGRQIVAGALASRTQVALATQPETRKHRFTVEARDGVVSSRERPCSNRPSRSRGAWRACAPSGRVR
jgi:hypothetical protein